MKKWVVLIIACLFTNILSQTNISPQFSELKGMEDQLGNTHLFYRVYLYQHGGPPYGDYFENCVYHLEPYSAIDSLFIYHGGYKSPYGSYYLQIDDYEFWDNDFRKLIIAATIVDTEPSPVVFRYDQAEPIFSPWQMWGTWSENVELSRQDSNLILVQMGDVTFRSSNWGNSWDTLSTGYNLLSISTASQEILFSQLELSLFKSSNAGNSFYTVDTGKIYQKNFLFDSDFQHIYSLQRKFGSGYSMYNSLIVSNNVGEPFSWSNLYAGSNMLFFSPDYFQSGKLFLADGKSIFVSTDYGNNFSLYKTLDRKIVGIYKKPNSNKLYAATKYKIYEITPDTIHVIKSLPIPQEILNYYPLAVGNRWVYDDYTYIEWNVYHDIYIREVASDTVFSNGKKYFRVEEYTSGLLYINYSFERIDSSSGMIYRYDNTLGLPDDEYLIDDLLAEVGDTVMSYRMGYDEYGFTRLLEELTFNKWSLSKPKKVFEEYTLHPPIYSLTQDIGLDSIYYYFDFGHTYIYLKGCVINGIVYGDTTTVGVEDEEIPIATNYKLEQNYPNPFNPSTSIQYAIGSRQFVTLKVYDVLGNEVATLVNEEKPAGEYEVEFNASSGIRNLVSGIYFYQLKAGSFIQTKKMVYLK